MQQPASQKAKVDRMAWARKRPAAVLFFSFLLLYVMTMGGHLYSPDEEVLFLTTKSLAERGSLAVRSGALRGFATRRGVDGREYAQYGIGQPLLAIPFYYFGRALAGWMGDRTVGLAIVQYHGETPREEWERFGVSLFNQFTAALMVTLLFALAFDLTGDRTAAVMTAVLYGAGTMAWVHSKPFFTETLATLFVFSSFALIVRARLYGRPRWITLAGFAAGYALLTRLDSLLAFPALGLLLVWPDQPRTIVLTEQNGDGRRERLGGVLKALVAAIHDRETWQRLARFVAPVLVFCVIIMSLNTARFGSPFATGYEDQPEGVSFRNPLLVGLYGFLLSVGKGVFFFSPPLVLFFWSIRRFTRLSPPVGWAVVVLLATVLLFHSKWINWAGGWCWGPRHIFMVNVFLALPISALLMAPRRPGLRVAYASLLAIGICVQLYGASQNFIDYYYLSYRVPFVSPTARVCYNPAEDGQNILSYYEVWMKPNALSPTKTRIAPWFMLAPISDSIWRIENSQWRIYARMWAEGFHDFFWLDLLGKRSRSHKVRPILAELQERASRPPRGER